MEPTNIALSENHNDCYTGRTRKHSTYLRTKEFRKSYSAFIHILKIYAYTKNCIMHFLLHPYSQLSQPK